jgi:cytochrome P450
MRVENVSDHSHITPALPKRHLLLEEILMAAAVSTAVPRVVPKVPGVPLFGNFLEMRRDRSKLGLRLAREYGDVAWLRAGPLRVLMVAGPELVKEFLVDKDDAFIKAPGLSYFGKPLLGNGLLTSEGAFHHKQRRMMGPMFVHKHIASYAQTMADRSEQHAALWTDGQELDVSQAMMAITLEIVGKTLFDAEVGEEAKEIGEALTAAMHVVIDSINSFVPIPPSWPTPRNLRNKKAIARLDATVYRMIAERRKSGVQDRGDLLSLLLAARDEEDREHRGMDDKQVRDEAMTLFLAGHETTANALAWGWYLLGRNPHAYARLLKEVDEVLGGRTPTLDDLPKLPYTLAVFKEAMRLYPPAYVIGRLAQRDLVLGDIPVKKNDIVFVNVIGMHRRADIFSDPESFDPDRFLGEREKAIPRHAYLPFGAGPRVCIGNHFAMMEGQLVVAAVAQRVRFELPAGTIVEPEPLVTLRPKGGVPMRVRRRVARA